MAFTTEKLEGKTLKQLEAIGAKLNKAKDEVLKQYREVAGPVQVAIEVAEKKERDMRNEDPEHRAKHQGVGQ